MVLTTVKRGFIYGLIQQKTSIHILYYGTFTKLCKLSFRRLYIFVLLFIIFHLDSRQDLLFPIIFFFFSFMVDSIPIRLYRNHADKGVAYPRWQPMSIKISLWNGDSWATRGGLDKIDWSKSPFIASFRDYKIDACVWNGNPRFCRTDSSPNWWNRRRFSTLTRVQKRWFKWVRKNYLVYDYCQDYQRFQNNLPKECSLPKY